MEHILKRDRVIIFAAVSAATLMAWGYMVHEARGMTMTGSCCCAGMSMSGPRIDPWSASTLPPLFLMWTEMMVAMMLPAALPMVLRFARARRQALESSQPFSEAGIFLAGYVAIWTAFSALAAVAQWALHAKALISPMMVGTSPVLGGALLLAAGIFQWAPIKNSCLAGCCSSLDERNSDRDTNRRSAFLSGMKQGVQCVGCCWLLMLLLFVTGVMNLWWIAILSVLVLIERILPCGLWLGKIAGVLFAGWGIWMIAENFAG